VEEEVYFQTFLISALAKDQILRIRPLNPAEKPPVHFGQQLGGREDRFRLRAEGIGLCLCHEFKGLFSLLDR
jgi:hypothetical protein